jgi:hypothetical protein
VIRGLAELSPEPGIEVCMIEDDGSTLEETDKTRWVLVTANRQFLSEEEVRKATRSWTSEDPAPFLFTDDYTNLFRVMIR